jgi:hypothetical protein
VGEIPEVMKKSGRSGSLWASVGQCVGVIVSLDYLDKFASFVVVSLEPQSVFLLLKSPPVIKLGPRVRKNASKCSAFKLCRGGQYTAAIVMSRRGPLTRTVVA